MHFMFIFFVHHLIIVVEKCFYRLYAAIVEVVFDLWNHWGLNCYFVSDVLFSFLFLPRIIEGVGHSDTGKPFPPKKENVMEPHFAFPSKEVVF